MKRHTNATAMFALVVLGAGCGAPNLDTEVEMFSTATAKALDGVDAMLAPEIAAERRALRDAGIQAGDPVIRTNPKCEEYVVGDPAGRASDCEIQDAVNLVHDGPASALGVLNAALRSYSAAIGDLARASEPERIGAATQRLLGNAAALRVTASAFSGQPPGGADLGAASGPLSNISVQAANAYKIRQIGRITRLVNPSIQEAVRLLAGAVEDRSPEFDPTVDERMEACSLVPQLQTPNASPDAYRAAIERCEHFQAQFRAIDQSSGRAAILAIGPTHSSLAAAARPGADFETILKLAEDLSALTAASKGGRQ